MKNTVRIFVFAAALLASAFTLSAHDSFVLKNGKIEVAVDSKGRLTSLKNVLTGQQYASGDALWRLYYDSKAQNEIQVLGSEQTPKVSSDGEAIFIKYSSLVNGGEGVGITLSLKVILEEDKVRFSSEMTNNMPHTIIREFQYPLVGDLCLPDDFKLFITDTGGQIYSNPKSTILRRSNNPPYKSPSQLFRQMDIKYPTRIASNCFAFWDDTQGLYFGSHDSTFQDTWHGLRLYPDAKGEFTRLEAGFYKYPNCFCGETWKCDANVVAPYSGFWHETSRIYRTWADTWWNRRPTPMWVRKMNSWQRIIFKHQYGEYLFRYSDLNGRIKDVANSVDASMVLAFGWWEKGMDNGYPAYDADPAQGGDEGWKKAVTEFEKSGHHLVVYFNGKLIDRESDYYKSGKGKNVCYTDNTGAEFTEQYKFTGQGTFLGSKNARTFAIADTRNPDWRQILLNHADRAYNYGASGVFYDQLGYGENSTNWDLSREFAVPNLCVAADKAAMMKILRDHINAKNPDFSIGTEWLTDAICCYADYIHIYTTTAGPNSMMDWFRYTFPEVIISDREVRDDSDIPRRVNNTLLVGLRNDIEIYRCRDLIDKTPVYQAYLAKANAIKTKYSDLLLLGTFKDCDGFSMDNSDVDANAFVNGDKMAIVVTSVEDGHEIAGLEVPGYGYVESSVLGNAKVSSDGKSVALGQYDLAVLVYKKLN